MTVGIPANALYTINNTSKTIIGFLENLYNNKADISHTHSISDTILLQSELNQRLYALGINKVMSATDGWHKIRIKTKPVTTGDIGLISFRLTATSGPFNTTQQYAQRTVIDIMCDRSGVYAAFYDGFPYGRGFKLKKSSVYNNIIVLILSSFYGNIYITDVAERYRYNVRDAILEFKNLF